MDLILLLIRGIVYRIQVFPSLRLVGAVGAES